jgi:hypothetical protein
VLAKKPDSPVAGNNLAFYYVAHEPTEERLPKAENIIKPLLKKYKDSPQMTDNFSPLMIIWLIFSKISGTSKDMLFFRVCKA